MLWRQARWLITGAGGGMGLAFVEAVLAEGGKVAAFTRTKAPFAPLIEKAGERLLVCALDITDDEARRRAFAEVEAAFGGVDVLVNNAGYGLLATVEECTDQQIRDIFEVNFFAASALTRLALPGMRRRAGYVVNISSVSGARGIAGSAYYAATKFALEGFSEALTQEGEDVGIKVLIVEPGAFRTEFFGASRVHAEAPIDDYPAMARRREMEAGNLSRGMHEPSAGVAAVLAAMEQDAPPERLALGRFASDMLIARAAERRAELERWAGLARSVDNQGG